VRRCHATKCLVWRKLHHVVLLVLVLLVAVVLQQPGLEGLAPREQLLQHLWRCLLLHCWRLPVLLLLHLLQPVVGGHTVRLLVAAAHAAGAVVAASEARLLCCPWGDIAGGTSMGMANAALRW
jgi:hypothetical protein